MPSHGSEKMNRYRKLYLKLFLGTGIPFGIIFGIIYSIIYSLEYDDFFIGIGILAGLFGGIFYGVFMSLILGSRHIRSVKRLQYRNSEDAMGVHHVRNVELQLPYDKAFDLCIESIRLIKKSKIQKKDISQGKITAKAGMTWKTWGDLISFDIRKIDNEKTQVIVSSRPTLRATLVDYGKNLENVERIISFLKEQSKTAHNNG